MTVPMSFAGGLGMPSYGTLMASSRRKIEGRLTKDLPHEMRAGEIIAWRVWSIGAEDALCAMFANYIWPADRPAEGKPNEGVGVHAFKTRQEALANYAYSRGVIGRVALFGEVIEHASGYRAQYGRVYEIIERIESPFPSLDPGLDFIFGFFERRRERKQIERLRNKYLAWRSNTDARVLKEGAAL